MYICMGLLVNYLRMIIKPQSSALEAGDSPFEWETSVRKAVAKTAVAGWLVHASLSVDEPHSIKT